MIYLTCATWMIETSHHWGLMPDSMKDWDDVMWDGSVWRYAPQDWWYRPEAQYDYERFSF